MHIIVYIHIHTHIHTEQEMTMHALIADLFSLFPWARVYTRLPWACASRAPSTARHIAHTERACTRGSAAQFVSDRARTLWDANLYTISMSNENECLRVYAIQCIMATTEWHRVHHKYISITFCKCLYVFMHIYTCDIYAYCLHTVRASARLVRPRP